MTREESEKGAKRAERARETQKRPKAGPQGRRSERHHDERDHWPLLRVTPLRDTELTMGDTNVDRPARPTTDQSRLIEAAGRWSAAVRPSPAVPDAIPQRASST